MSRIPALKLPSVFLFFLFLSIPAFASHPSLLMDPAELSHIQNQVTNNTQAWQNLQGQCQYLVETSTDGRVSRPNAISNGDSNARPKVLNLGGGPYLFTGFGGNNWVTYIQQLGLCYLADSNASNRTKYLTIAHYVIQAFAQPMIQMTRQSDGAVRYVVSVDHLGNDLATGSAPQVFSYYPTNSLSAQLKVNDIWTIGSATDGISNPAGCVTAHPNSGGLNGTWKVSSIKNFSIYFTNADGSTATPLAKGCTLYSIAFGDFASRFYMPALAMAYDWLYNGLDANPTFPDRLTGKGDITILQAALEGWVHEMAVCPTELHPESNYAHSYIWNTIASYIAINSDPDPPTWFAEAGTTAYNTWKTKFLGPNAMRDYRQRWFRGGGAGEGWQAYAYDSERRVLNAELAMMLYNGTDWRQSPYNFTLLDDTLQYFMEFTTPSKLALDDNEYTYPIGTSYIRNGKYSGQWFPTESVWIPLGNVTMFAAMANIFDSPYSSEFQSWYDTIYAAEQANAGTLIPAWNSGVYRSAPALVDDFMYSGLGAMPSNWTGSPLMYRAWSGNYAVTRSDWSNTATEVTLLGGPTLGSAGNGKTQFDSGAITIQAGNNRLLEHGLGTAARASDLVTNYVDFNSIHSERDSMGNKKNSVWWASKNDVQTQNQGLGALFEPPGQADTISTFPASIDRAEDTPGYTYFRANHLEASCTRYYGQGGDGKYHQGGWVREVFFLRPSIVVVHDQTQTLSNSDERHMIWTFGRDISQVTFGVPSGMTRFDASYDSTYRGAYWSILPKGVNFANTPVEGKDCLASDTTLVVDHDCLHFLFRLEPRPYDSTGCSSSPCYNHNYDDWLTLFQTASSSSEIYTPELLNGSNVDAIQLNDPNNTVIAFARGVPLTGTVTTSGRVVKWASGTQFASSFAGAPILINKVSYTVQSVNSSTSLTLVSAAPAQKGVPYSESWLSMLPISFTAAAGNINTLPTYVVGLAPSTAYQYCVSGATLAINRTCFGGTTIRTTSSGVLVLGTQELKASFAKSDWIRFQAEN